MPSKTKNPILVIENGKTLKIVPLLFPLGTLVIYAMIVPIFILDVSTSIYQKIYFTALGIPKINKKKYVVMERWNLSKLNLLQKINCVYCEYSNGILAFAKAVGNQTEIYSCAIKHQHALKENKHEKNFYSEGSFKS